MKKRTKVILIILLVVFLTPKFEVYNSEYEVWQWGNFHYDELIIPENRRITDPSAILKTGYEANYVCYDVMPHPKYIYSYETMFIEIRYLKDYCEDWEWYQDNAINIQILSYKFESFIWISISNTSFDFTILDYWYNYAY